MVHKTSRETIWVDVCFAVLPVAFSFFFPSIRSDGRKWYFFLFYLFIYFFELYTKPAAGKIVRLNYNKTVDLHAKMFYTTIRSTCARPADRSGTNHRRRFAIVSPCTRLSNNYYYKSKRIWSELLVRSRFKSPNRPVLFDRK